MGVGASAGGREAFSNFLSALPAAFAATVIFPTCLFYQVFTGVGVWGNNHPVMWGLDIVNFIWWVGVVHAGWQGLLAGVVAAGVAALRALHDGPVRAVLGPCIHAGRYEFGEDALVPMVERFGPTVASRTDWGTPSLDVPSAVGIALREAGVAEWADVDVCTAESPDHFSHRRDGVSGRQAVVVVRTP